MIQRADFRESFTGSIHPRVYKIRDASGEIWGLETDSTLR
jgi:hypothetical protein